MMYLRLDRMLADVCDDETIEHECFTFNGGERHIKIKPKGDCFNPRTVTIETSGYGNVMDVLLAADALRRLGVDRINLLLPYVPYARQDRVMVRGEPLSAKVFAELINSQCFEKVYTLDNHSPVITALLNDVVEIDQYRIWDEVIENAFAPILICPDAGAMKKTYAIAAHYGGKSVECSKERCVATGEIISTRVNAVNFNKQTCIIIDDICDGGRTFTEIATVLKKKNAGKIILYVTHGIFSKGLEPFKGLIDKVYTTNLKPNAMELNVPFDIVPLLKGDLR